MTRSAYIAAAAAADIALVLVFCALGRRSHGEVFEIAGFIRTAWPFLFGVAVGWLVVYGWQRVRSQNFAPWQLVPAGLTIWVIAVPTALTTRGITGQSVALSFLIVAWTVLGIFLLGWRGAARLIAKRRYA